MPSPAHDFPALFPRDALHPAALAWADAHANDDAPWCVAFSGGADSVALIATLCEHWPARRDTGKIIALHFNHRLRGSDSDGDEQFCRDTCAALGIRIRAGRWIREDSGAPAHAAGIPHSASRTPHASEADARAARHEFFEREMAALGARALWLGHQRDDIAETQLMRLARGSSTAGLAAPRPAHTRADGRIFLRPLLTLSKKEITAALRARGLAWREDATNTATPADPSGDYFRNRIRRDVLPAWIAAAENDALAGAALSRELLDEDAAALDAWLDELMPPQQTDGGAEVQGSEFGVQCSYAIPMAQSRPTPNPELRTLNSISGGVPPLDLRPLSGKPRALLRRALRRWPPAAELARAGFEELLAICESPDGGRTSVGENVAVFENGILRLAAPTAPFIQPFGPVSLPIGTHTALALPDGAWLAAREFAPDDALREQIFSGKFDPIDNIFIAAPAEKNALCVRFWRAGDRYRPLGAPGSAKLSDAFVNRKIPHERRFTLPIVCDAHGEIVCVPGLPPAEAWKITPQTPLGLRLTYQCGTCTVGAQSL